jgi:uncharacterized protein DUF2510
MTEETVADPGWYPDAQDAALLRYFDGQSWTPHTRQVAELNQQGPAQQQATAQGAAQTQQLPQSPQPQGQAWAAQAQQQQQGWEGRQQGWEGQQTQATSGAYGSQATGYGPGYAPGYAAPYDPGQGQPQPKRRRRKPLLIALAAVVIIAAGLVTFFAVSGDDPKYTYNGKPIASAAKVLSSAEDKVAALVKQRHGAKNSDTRCYFAQPKKPSGGAKKTDVDSSLRCGPVLFVDGDAAREYLPVKLTQTSSKGGQAKLTVAGALDDVDPVAISAAFKLSRPDGDSAPKGDGGLKVPAPPPAADDALLATDLGTTTPPKALSGAAMGAQSTTVTLTAAGAIPRYGEGDNARSAPAGKELVAFQLKYSGGDVSDSAADRATLVVAGGSPRQLPDLADGQWIVAAVPSAGASLSLVANGVSQTLSLPDGKPGANNIAVLTRTHHSAFLFRSFSVPVKASKGHASTGLTFHAQATVAALDYWVPGHTNRHASSPHNGILSVALTYTRKGASGRFGFAPGLLRLRLPDGRVLGAHNVASAGHVDDVFEVPANFTRGTLQITGSTKASGGVTLRVTKTASLTVSIPAG